MGKRTLTLLVALFMTTTALVVTPVALARPEAGGGDARGATAIATAEMGTITLSTPERTLLRLINNARAARGLHTLRLNAALYRAAKAHSRDMLARSYFSHSTSGGESFASRILAYGYRRAGYASWRVGEVIGWGKDSAGSPRAVLRRWMRSSGHRAVILAARWRDIGVGRAVGTYLGMSNVKMYTVDFGRRTR